MFCLEIKNLSKNYTNHNQSSNVFSNVNLHIKENEFICILGPSGCGKSTLLRLIAGLEEATTGKIMFKNRVICKPQKEIGMVFQNYSLMPWLNVEDNISLGLQFAGLNKRERQEKAEYFLQLIHMEKCKKMYPHELSGGMQQRVAIARALATNPDVILMDEPFGALDAYTRILLQKELLSIWENNKKTIIFVTHSVDESIYLADRIIFMSHHSGSIKKEIVVNIRRERHRSNPLFGELADELLGLFQ